MTDTDKSASQPGSLTRRQTLQALAGGVGGGGLGIALLPDTTALQSDAEQDTAAVDQSTTPRAESELPYAVWQYHYEPGTGTDGFTRTSPINVVSPLDTASFDDIVDVFTDAGMAAFPLEYTLYAWDREANRYRQTTWSGADNTFGLAGRVDVRCWKLDGTASMQAHVDSAVTPKHEVTSYAKGRAAVETLFEDAGWVVADERLDFGNDKPPDHDGTVSVIRR